jgi:putative transcriptional regulator
VVHRVVVLTAGDVRAIRRRTGLSRAKFAERFGLDPRAVQDWEQGRRAPDRAARVLLLTIDPHPDAVRDAVAA